MSNFPDKTALIKKIEELESHVNYLEEIISALPGHVYWKDRNGILQGCNLEQAHSAGLKSRHEIKGLRPIDLINKNQPEEERIKQANEITRIDNEVMDNNREVIAEEPAVLPNGEVGIFISKKVPLHNNHNQVIGLVGVTLDITHQKKFKEKAEIISINKNKAKFIFNIYHHLKTPIDAALDAMDLIDKKILILQKRNISARSQNQLI